MTAPLQRGKRKNPILRTRAALIPPATRSRVALRMTAAAAEGRLELQVCTACSEVQYPPREACVRCLATELKWQEHTGQGELISATQIAHSNDLFFLERLPWRLGMVRLDTGQTLITHLHGDVANPPVRVRVGARLDRGGRAVLLAYPHEDSPNMTDDRQLREMTCDPKFRKVLVSDGKTAVGQALVRALLAAGADLVWVGHAEPWKRCAGFEELTRLAQVTPVPLDVTNGKSVAELAGEIGGRVDILVNNAELHRTHGISSRPGTDVARAEMDVNFFGLLRLAQSFGPAMRARAADGELGAAAWVNILSIFALSNFPAHGTFSASKAAAQSLSQCLRAEMRPAAIRVVNVYPGPLDDEWNQLLPPPKLAPQALARAVCRALQDGVEDVYPGDVAKEWRAKWREDPRVLERELTQ